VADPLFIMPLLSGATFLATVEARPRPCAVFMSQAARACR
jgi:hypothetical protein